MRGLLMDWNVKDQRMMPDCFACIGPGSLYSGFQDGKIVWSAEVQIWGSPEAAQKNFEDRTNSARTGMPGDPAKPALDSVQFGPVGDDYNEHPELTVLKAFAEKYPDAKARQQF